MNTKSQVAKMLRWYLVIIPCCVMLCFAGRDAVTVMVEKAPLEDRTCIAIDAGHGGVDGGAISCTGVSESTINLEIAQRLDDLVKLLGYDTLMLRNDDTSLHTDGSTIAAQKVSDLRYRVKVVNEKAPKVMVSIHQNTFSDPQYQGAQVFYSSQEFSKDLAQKMQENFVNSINQGSKRKAKPAKGIYLMEHIQCAGVLIECGFLTNPTEEALLRNEKYQKDLCCVISSTLSNWLNEKGTIPSNEIAPE